MRQVTGTELNAISVHGHSRPEQDSILCRRRIYGLFIPLYLAGAAAFAETPPRSSFEQSEMVLMAEANLAYTSCLQEYAQENMESDPDIRVIAADAVESCNAILDELQTVFKSQGINPAFYMGAINRIKNRAIRRLLPLLMMEKSNQGS